ncbi:hypothetical protein [Paenibacillus sp.]|uniref:hypothetical protein n=1 Tax=Paenibacillus sp. TaxID=58172 RepID=UPI002810B39D|nr:hypothetical protein [Paenibacillus sp.]
MKGRTIRLFGMWVALTIAGYAFGGYFGHFPGGYNGEGWKLSAGGWGLLVGGVTGAVAGLLQRPGLRALRIPAGGRWVLAHAAGIGLTHAFLDFRADSIHYLPITAVGGMLLGALCGWALGSLGGNKLLWTAAGGLSWTAALLLSAALLHGPADAWKMNHIYDGLTVGVVNGIVFASLLIRCKRREPGF